MAQASVEEQKGTNDDGNHEQENINRLSYSSWIRCQYKKKSSIVLQSISDIFKSTTQFNSILENIFPQDSLEIDNQQNKKIILKAKELKCIYVFSKFNQQSNDQEKIEGSQ